MDFPDARTIHRIAARYPLEADAHLFVERPSWTHTGCMSREDLFAVVEWKANRIKNRFWKDDANQAADVPRLTEESLSPFLRRDSLTLNEQEAEEIKVVLRALTSLNFVHTRVASAILAVFRPTLFTVMDYRARDALLRYREGELLRGLSLNRFDTYVQYLRVCHGLSEQAGVSLRNLDRFLYVLGGTRGTHQEYVARRDREFGDSGW